MSFSLIAKPTLTPFFRQAALWSTMGCMEAIVNKRAYFDYTVLETYEAGIELLGFEVKSIRKGSMSLRASFVTLRDNQLWLTNAVISPYQPQNTPANYDSTRSRRLLLHKKEIARLTGKLREKGLTMVPLKVYNKHSKIKVEIGVVKGKKQYDKREVIKKRDTEREIRRVVIE